MTSPSTSRNDFPLEARLKSLLPETNGAVYIGQRMVRLTLEELEEVIATLAQLRDAARTPPDREGQSDGQNSMGWRRKPT